MALGIFISWYWNYKNYRFKFKSPPHRLIITFISLLWCTLIGESSCVLNQWFFYCHKLVEPPQEGWGSRDVTNKDQSETRKKYVGVLEELRTVIVQEIGFLSIPNSATIFENRLIPIHHGYAHNRKTGVHSGWQISVSS